MAKRVFEHDGRFWEVWTAGTEIFTRFGTEGEGGHLTVEDAGAQVDHVLEARVQARVASGYLEQGPGGAEGAIDAGELDDQIASLPPLVDDPGYLVFADWLQARGSKWGELVAIQYNAAHAKGKQRAALESAAAALLAKRGEALVGPAFKHPQTALAWHHGFIERATLGTSTDPAEILAALQALVAQRAARMIRGVVFHPIPTKFDVHRDWSSSTDSIVDPWTNLDALAQALPAHVTHLGFGGWPAPAASAYLRMPAFSAISARFPTITKLELTGALAEEPGRLALDALTDLEVRFADADGLEALRESKLDGLERFSLWLGGHANCILDDVYDYEDGGYPDAFDGDDLEALEVHDVTSSTSASDLGEMLDALPPTLSHLGIRSALLDGDMLATLVAHPLVGKLASLDLSGGTLDDAAAKILIGAKKQLARLAIDVERNRIGAATAKKLVAALPRAKAGNQRKAQEPELFMRFVATME